MVETQFPKFKWETVSEQNSGHTKDEWGIKKEMPKTIVAYSLVWEK
jgi:hypothetical protein